MNLRRKFGGPSLGQSVTELALVLPIMLFLVYGVFELGRVVFIFSALNNATREAARYGAAAGLSESGAPSYLDCAAIRQTARESAFLASLNDSDIQIAYDKPVTTTGTMDVYGHCGPSGPSREEVRQGDRILITVTKTVEPILPILPSGGFSLNFATARTILKDIVIGPVECSDDLDNDGDGFTDYDGDGGTPDSGCSGPDDTTEAFCYTLNVVSTPAEAGNLGIQPDPNCANRYIESTTVHLTASAAERYIFKRWSGSINSTANPVSFVMDSDKDVVAEFRLRTSDLEVTKSASPNPVYSSNTLSYEIFVTNLYTETAQNVVITDTLPAGVQLQNVSISSGSCPYQTDAEVRCQIDELPRGSTATLSIDVEAPVVNYSPTNLTNSVVASAFEHDPDLTNNTATVTSEVKPRAELSADSKVDSIDPVDAGSQFDYTITVGNTGPSIATGVTVIDDLPAGMTFLSSADSCAVVDAVNNVVECDVGELGVGATASVAFTVKAPRNTPANTNEYTYTNEASVDGNEYETSASNNTVSETTLVVRRADLFLTKAAPASAYRDASFDYVLSVGNAGPSDALDVQITDTLPAGVQYNSFASTKPGASCSLSGGTVTCDMGTVARGDSYDVTLNVTPTIDEGTLTNSATVSSSTNEADPSDNSSNTVETVVSTYVELAISKTDSADPVSEGDAFTYTIEVDNNGASTANGVSVVDNLPDEINFVDASATGWSCSNTEPPNATITCTPPDGMLHGGTGATITVDVTAGAVTEPLRVTNSVTIDAIEDTATAEATTTVEPSLDLSLGVTAPVTGEVGVAYDYVIAVANSGPSRATDVTVVSTLTSTVTYNNVTITSGSGWACSYVNDADGRRVLCTALALEAGAEASFTITVTPELAVDVPNDGVVTAAQSAYDSDSTNDSHSATTTIETTTVTAAPDD